MTHPPSIVYSWLGLACLVAALLEAVCRSHFLSALALALAGWIALQQSRLK